MAKVPMINTLLLMISRRSYSSVAAEDASVQPVVAAMMNAAESGSDDVTFWRRHPKSGNWIPETHFDEIDVAELREKLLPKKKKP